LEKRYVIPYIVLVFPHELPPLEKSFLTTEPKHLQQLTIMFTTYFILLIIGRWSTEVQHLPKDAELSEVVEKAVSGLEHQILYHLQRYVMTVVILLPNITSEISEHRLWRWKLCCIRTFCVE